LHPLAPSVAHTRLEACGTHAHTRCEVGGRSATGSFPECVRGGYRLGGSRKPPYSYELCLRYHPNSVPRRV